MNLSEIHPGMHVRHTEHPGLVDIVTEVTDTGFTVQPNLKGGCIVHLGGWSMPRIRHTAGVAAILEPVPGAADAAICTASHGKGAHVRWGACP